VLFDVLEVERRRDRARPGLLVDREEIVVVAGFDRVDQRPGDLIGRGRVPGEDLPDRIVDLARFGDLEFIRV